MALVRRSGRAKFAECEAGGNLGLYCGSSREKGGGLVSERLTRQPEEKKASPVRNPVEGLWEESFSTVMPHAQAEVYGLLCGCPAAPEHLPPHTQ